MAYQLIFSPVFNITLRRLCHFLARKYSPELAQNTKAAIRLAITKHLPSNPFIGPVCERLMDMGVSDYRQLLIDQHNMLIYQIDENNQEIHILLVFDTRQNLTRLLSDVNLRL